MIFTANCASEQQSEPESTTEVDWTSWAKQRRLSPAPFVWPSLLRQYGHGLLELDMSEIIFLVEEAPESGFLARAAGESVFTQADSIDELHREVRDAVKCHFDADNAPQLIRLQFVRDEVITAA